LGSQIKHATKIGARYVAMVSLSDVEAGTVRLKNLQKREQYDIKIEELSHFDFDANEGVKVEQEMTHPDIVHVSALTNTDDQELSQLVCQSLQLDLSNSAFNVNVDTKTIDLEEYARNTKPSDIFLIWYLGSRGSTAQDFYEPILYDINRREGSTFLLDLKAWGAFFYKKGDITAIGGESLFSLFDMNTIIHSAHFFQDLAWKQSVEPYKSLITDIFTREELYQPSEEYPETGISVGSILQSPMPDGLDAKRDTSNVYSVFQYAELLYLIERIVVESPQTSYTINLLLPNDELKYYPIDYLTTDVTKYLNALQIVGANVNINLCTFKYGSSPKDRPYNTVKK
jgi:hypothetical protein